VAGTLSFGPGETSKTFQILLNEDIYVEGGESFNVSLTNPAGAVLGQQSSSAVLITDDLAESAINPLDDAQSFVYTHYQRFP
jgi:hypothetical protein